VKRSFNLKSDMHARLAESRYGRIMLHVICALRDHHLGWHWRGIHRELARRTV
jgi:hypothetical protein